MRRLVDLIDPRSVEPELQSRRKHDAIEEMLAVLGRSLWIPQPSGWLRELVAREKLASTGVGNGIAIPHKLFQGVERSALALGRRREGIPFDAIDGAPATLLFLMVGPEGQPGEHLRLLSRLARLLRDQSLVRALLEAPDAAGMLEALAARDAG